MTGHLRYDILIITFRRRYNDCFVVKPQLHFRTNSPYQTMEFAGFPFPEGSPTYMTGTCYYNYLKAFVKKFDLIKYIQVTKS